MEYPVPEMESTFRVETARARETVEITDRDQHAEDTFPPFSHTPPATIRGRHRWPNSLEAQGFPETNILQLSDILIWVVPYLETEENAKITMHGERLSSGTRVWSSLVLPPLVSS